MQLFSSPSFSLHLPHSCSLPLSPLPLSLCPLQAEFFHRAVAITKAQKAVLDGKGLKKVSDFRASLHDTDTSTWPAELAALKKDISAFAQEFPVVGFDSAAMRYKD